MLILIIVITTVFFVFLVFSFFFFLKLYYRRNQDFMIQLQETQFKNERNLLTMQIEVKEETLESISREIHDNIGQRLSLAKLHLITSFPFDDPIQNDKVSAAVQLMSGTLVELNDISRTMSSDFISHHGLCKVIEMETKQLIRLSAYQIDFKVVGEKVFLNPNKELVSFRVFQEALNNIIKHSECTRIEIILHYQDRCIEMIINDNGKGFNTDLPVTLYGAGMHNMAKRASLIDATVRIKTAVLSGTSLVMKIPYDE